MTKAPTMQATRQIDVRTALKEGIAQLAAANASSPELAAELLLIHATRRDRTWLYAHSTDPLDNAQIETYLALIARRAAGEPTQYITGKQEFWSLELEVTPAVLIPRPETEHLIEVAIERLAEKRNVPLRIADVGTGSGCIAIALAMEFPNANITATDISTEALKVAQRNAARHEVSKRIEFTEADLLQARVPQEQSSHSPLDTSHYAFASQKLFDVIISNPPYIAPHEAKSLPREVRDHEPSQALFAGPKGTEIYERLIAQAEKKLKNNGLLILELGYNSEESVSKLLRERSGWKGLQIKKDLAGIVRVISTERQN
jgi:release factor glutamine methyltransferase